MTKQLRCKKCNKSFNDCKCPDKYARYNKKKNKKIGKVKTLSIIALILIVCFLVLAAMVIVDAINTPDQNHSSKTVYYNPLLNNTKTHSRTCSYLCKNQ
jgi:hypothetical protein